MNSLKIITLFMCMMVMTFTIQVAKDVSQRTFAMIKPYAVKREIVDEIIDIIEKAGFAIVAMKKMTLTPLDVHQLYEDRADKRWFTAYVRAMTASPVIVMILEKENAVEEWDFYKRMIRETYFTMCKKNNIVHGSDCLQAAAREITLFFEE